MSNTSSSLQFFELKKMENAKIIAVGRLLNKNFGPKFLPSKMELKGETTTGTITIFRMSVHVSPNTHKLNESKKKQKKSDKTANFIHFPKNLTKLPAEKFKKLNFLHNKITRRINQKLPKE